MATVTNIKTASAAKAKAKPAASAAAPAAPAKKGSFGRPASGAAPAKKAAAPARKKTPLPQFEAPADFRPHFVLVSFQTDRDGLLGASLKAVRYAGRFDREADERKKANMIDYDPQTVVGIAARLAAITFKTSIDRIMPATPSDREGLKGSNRLPKTAVFEALIRVGKRSADQTLTAGVRQVFQIVKTKSAKTGKMITKTVELSKTDPASRMIRRVNRILPAAFKNVMMPPKRSSRRSADDAEE